jgi:hypothetical protein
MESVVKRSSWGISRTYPIDKLARQTLGPQLGPMQKFEHSFDIPSKVLKKDLPQVNDKTKKLVDKLQATVAHSYAPGVWARKTWWMNAWKLAEVYNWRITPEAFAEVQALNIKIKKNPIIRISAQSFDQNLKNFTVSVPKAPPVSDLDPVTPGTNPPIVQDVFVDTKEVKNPVFVEFSPGRGQDIILGPTSDIPVEEKGMIAGYTKKEVAIFLGILAAVGGLAYHYNKKKKGRQI